MPGLSAPFGPGGLATQISLTPATWAGMTVISTVETSGAVPAGMYMPARSTGRKISPVSAPALFEAVQSCRSCRR